MASEASEATVNIPQLAVLFVIGYLAVRWMLTSRADQSSDSSSSQTTARTRAAGTTAAGVEASLRHVETIAGIFPHLDRRSIMWDLQRNGNNVQMTTNRVLSGQALETPPQSFQPQLLAPRAMAWVPAGPAGSSKKSTQPDLIQRYNLGGRLAHSEATDSSDAADTPGSSTWSSNKSERQSALQKRREEMILAARKKMLEKQERQV